MTGNVSLLWWFTSSALGWLAGQLIAEAGRWLVVRMRRPKCPICGRRLRRVEVHDIADPTPLGAVWYCAAGTRTRYFGDRPAAKPAPVEEL